MDRRFLAACIALCVFAIATTVATASSAAPPRFALSAATAAWGSEVTVRVERGALPARRGVRFYLVPRGAAASVRSRFDSRLSFIGSIPADRKQRGNMRFTVPPLDAGSYVLAYWCSGCLAHEQGVTFQRSPLLQIAAPPAGTCPVTQPSGTVPRGAPPPAAGWSLQGNGTLWVLLPVSRTLTTNELGGYKMFWIGQRGISPFERLTVQYRLLEPESAPVSAQTGSGTLLGYDGPSWASRMSFQPGCWQITGHLLDASLSFVVQVAGG
jgi:hypothetical protein